MNFEYEDESGDPSGYSYVTWRGFSFCSSGYDEELQIGGASKLNDSQADTTMSNGTEEESRFETFRDEHPVEGEQGRLQRFIIICFICLFGTYVFFVGKKGSSHEVEDVSTPTVAPSTHSTLDFLPIEEEPSLNTTCFICGSADYSVSNPDTVPLFQSAVDLPKNITCSDLDYIGQIDNSITPGKCAALISQTQIFQQCGCNSTKNDIGEDGLSVAGKPLHPNFPSCSICGSGKMNNPSATVSISVPWGYLENTICENLDAVGLTGYISPQACSDIQSSKQIVETCCLAPNNATIPGESQVLPFPQCFLCGSATDEISNPDSILSLPTFLGYPDNTTCAYLNNIGKDGKIRPEHCSVIRSKTEKIKQCGCSNFFDV